MKERSSVVLFTLAWLAVLTASWVVGEGVPGPLYLALYVLAVLPGLPLGFALFGRGHPAGWLSGAAIGYVLALLAIWTATMQGMASRGAFITALALLAIVIWPVARRRSRSPAVPLPPWSRTATGSYVAIVLLTLALAAPPLATVGAHDPHGNIRYRAYFTADFVWHSALTAELTRFNLPPRNPYLAPQPIHYYWGYFLMPAAVAQAGPAALQNVERCLKLNALVTGLLFMSLIFIAALVVVQSPLAAAAGTSLAIVASSLEGLYELWRLWVRHQPFSFVRDVNVDALTAWDFSGHRIDGLPRCLWYVPQHSMAYALGLIALAEAAAVGAEAPLSAIVIVGLALGGATLINPFVGGIFSVVWGLAIAIDVIRRQRWQLSRLALNAVAAVPVCLAVVWCVQNRMVEGAGGALEFGLAGASRNAPFTTFALSFGPVVVAAAIGVVCAVRARLVALVPAGLLAAVSLFLMYYVRLNVDHEWVPFRAGQMLLAAFAVMAAAFFAAPRRPAARRAAAAVGIVLLALGAPTTIIDAYNARDIDNVHAGPGFHWTLVISPDQQAAFDWIRHRTPRSTVVQMEPMVRQRDSWSLIPSFAQRDMAAGLPISLLRIPDYEQRSQQVKTAYACVDPKEAASMLRGLGVRFIYVDATDRAAYPGVAKFDASPQYFHPTFRQGPVAVYQVQ